MTEEQSRMTESAPEPVCESNVWQDAVVLVACLLSGSFIVMLVPAFYSNEHVGQALAVSLGYALIAALYGIIPLAVYSFIYSFCRRYHPIGYKGVLALALSVAVVYSAVVQIAMSRTPQNFPIFTVLAVLNAVPTALSAHFLLTRRSLKNSRSINQ